MLDTSAVQCNSNETRNGKKAMESNKPNGSQPHQNEQEKINKKIIQSQKFTSNMCAILNDPRKDRVKINYLFTKTWGNGFTEHASVPHIHTIHSTYSNMKAIEFKEYIRTITERHSKFMKNKLESNSKIKNDSQNQTLNGQKSNNDLEQIPKIFFDPNFSLCNKETFNAITSFRLFDKSQKETKQTVSTNINPFLLDSNKTSRLIFDDSELCQEILEKLGLYLDITETHISKQISTKANTFFHAMTSQDEVQEHVLKTCTAVKCLRKNIINLDERVVVSSLRAIKLASIKLKYKSLVEKLELISFVYKTQPTIQLHLTSGEFTGALDLIAMSQEILRQDLRGVRSLRHFDSQFSEIEKVIDKMLHQEFTKYIISDLSRSFSDGSKILNEEKLWSLTLGILRIKTSPFIDQCKEEIFVYLKSTVKQTVVEYVSQVDDDSLNNADDDNNIRLVDKVKQLKIQEFLHLLSRVLTNVRTMLGRVKSIVNLITNVVDSAAGLKSEETKTPDLIINESFTSNKELINKLNHSKLVNGLKELMKNSSDYAQERLVNLLEGKFKETGLEKLNTNDFISLSNLIDQFIIDFDAIADKKTSSLRSWIQNQANKFLHKFHNEKKEKLTLALESERWKQCEIPIDFKNLVDHIIVNGMTIQGKKFDAKVKNASEFISIDNEKYVIFGTVIVLIKLMAEYCQFTTDIPNLAFDVMTRLVELFKSFNSKTFQMILGGGAVLSGLLRIITFKTLVITYRCLELILYFLPKIRDFFKEKLIEKQTNSEKQFNLLIKDYNEHKIELINKLVSMIDENFREFFSQYEVIAPVPSQCFRSICQQITRVYEIVTEILSNSTVIQIFTEIHLKFKQRLSQRLKELNVVNDGGPQHALIFSDMSYYIKQFKSLNGLHVITLSLEDVWSS